MRLWKNLDSSPKNGNNLDQIARIKFERT